MGVCFVEAKKKIKILSIHQHTIKLLSNHLPYLISTFISTIWHYSALYIVKRRKNIDKKNFFSSPFFYWLACFWKKKIYREINGRKKSSLEKKWFYFFFIFFIRFASKKKKFSPSLLRENIHCLMMENENIFYGCCLNKNKCLRYIYTYKRHWQ